MDHQSLNYLFVDELETAYSAENQMIRFLERLIELSSFPDLKHALTHYLDETRNQVTRLEEIFAILDLPAQENLCEGMEGILKEADEVVQNRPKGATLDAAIISLMQKVEHYEIAFYATLRSFAKNLELDVEVRELLQETLNEAAAAERTLTKIAEGTLFSRGINKEAAMSLPD